MRLAVYTQSEFLNSRWNYKQGEHVTMCAPTGIGKTTWAFRLGEVSATPTMPMVTFSTKPRDETVDDWALRLKHKEIRGYPPPWWHHTVVKPSGYVLRPPFTFDPEIDDANQYREFRRALLTLYRKGGCIINGDELYGLVQLGLGRELTTLWSRGRSMGAGLWGGVQKPTHIPLWGFNNAQHLFLGSEPDFRNRKRFGEFGGVDPKMVESITATLPDYHMLYLRRRGRVAAVIEPDNRP